jgi:hypothetical protein
MVSDRVTPRLVLWLAGACLLLLPAFVSTAQACPGRLGQVGRALHVSCHRVAGPKATARPFRKAIDDNDPDDLSDDLIGDTWLAPCALPACGAVDAMPRGVPGKRQPRSRAALRSFNATDPFAPRPPPARFLL